jgi:hypothetical protein
MSYWSRFRNWFAINFYKFFNRSLLLNPPQKSNFLLGPIVGLLKYEVGLMSDSRIIAVCRIEDGMIVPEVTATSKSEILNYL